MSQVIIHEGPVWSQLEGPAEALGFAQGFLVVEDPKAQHKKSFRYGHWDGTVKFFNRASRQFLSGLTPRLTEALQGKGFTVSHRPCRFSPGRPVAPHLKGLALRPYQVTAVDRACEFRRVALQSPTGSGKTEIGLEIVRRLGQPTLWLVNSASLLEQTIQRVRARLPGVSLGVIQGKTVTPGLLTLAMVQTLSRYAAKDPIFAPWKVLILDEAHHGWADTWKHIAMSCPNAVVRIGLSGTIQTRNPVRDMGLEGLTGPMFVVEETLSLAEQGFLAKPRVIFIDVPAETFPAYADVRQAVLPDWRRDPRRLASMGHKLFAEAYSRGVMDNQTRTDLLLRFLRPHLRNQERVLIACRRRPHAEGLLVAIQTTFPDTTAWRLDGEDSPETRATTIDLFRKSRAEQGAVLVCTPFFREGMDLPEIDTAFLAGGGQSELELLQWIGRALRPRPDKPEVLIYDLWDGHDMADPKDYLANHTLERLTTYRRQGWAVSRLRLRPGAVR